MTPGTWGEGVMAVGMEGVRQWTVEEGGERLDRFLARHCPDLTRSRLQRLIEEGSALVNGVISKPAYRLKPGDQVVLQLPAPRPIPLAPEAGPLPLVYEDEDLLVVDKPPGLPVHPGPGHPAGTLVHRLLAYCQDLSGIGGALRPGIVHRLDKETSGLLLVAKNDTAHLALARALKERRVHKGYLALVWGVPDPPEGEIDAPIGRDPYYRKRMAVIPQGRPARTRYRLLATDGRASLLEVFPETGRTHQVRVHLASRGHPLVGDPLYSRRRRGLVGRQFLHAHLLRFPHPRTGRWLSLSSPLPVDLKQALQRLGLPSHPGAPAPTAPMG